MKLTDPFEFLINNQLIIDKISIRFWGHVTINKPEECWPWSASLDGAGYGIFVIQHAKKVGAHRAAFFFESHISPHGLLVCHRCDNPPCCNPRHLFLGTVKDNSDDMVNKGRNFIRPQKGENNGMAKLTENEVYIIRTRILNGETNKSIAKDYSVTHSMISRIKLGKSWI